MSIVMQGCTYVTRNSDGHMEVMISFGWSYNERTKKVYITYRIYEFEKEIQTYSEWIEGLSEQFDADCEASEIIQSVIAHYPGIKWERAHETKVI